MHVPEVPHEPSGVAYMRPSSLGMCALKHAYDKLGVEPDFPELTPEQNPAKAWLMDHGSYVAPMIQEALLYLNASEPEYSFSAEVPFVSNDYHLAGRLDGLLEVDGVQYVLEIKDTEGMVQRSVGEPKLAYALQLLSYMMVMGISHGFIITVSKWGFNCYEVRPEAWPGPSFGHAIYDQWGNRYEPPAWFGADWNTPDVLNFDRVKAEIQKLSDTVETVQRLQKSTTQYSLAPITDPLNDPQGWLCFRTLDKGTKARNRLVTPNCPFAGRCHGVHNKEYEAVKVDGRYEFA